MWWFPKPHTNDNASQNNFAPELNETQADLYHDFKDKPAETCSPEYSEMDQDPNQDPENGRCYLILGGGQPISKKSQVQKSPKSILGGGGQPISKKSQVQKSPNPARGGWGHVHFGLIPKFRCFFDWKASLTHVYKNNMWTLFG